MNFEAEKITQKIHDTTVYPDCTHSVKIWSAQDTVCGGTTLDPLSIRGWQKSLPLFSAI